MRRKVPSSSPLKSTQTTLASFFSSPPTKSPRTQATTPKSKTRRRKRARAATPRSENEDDESDASDVGAIHFEPEVIDLSDEEEEESPRRPAAKRRTRRVRTDTSSSGEAEIRTKHSCSYDDDKSEGSLRRKGRRVVKRKQVDEESETEDSCRPKKRKFIKGVRPSSPEEDEDNILDEVEEHLIIEPRLRTRDKKTTFQKNLERLKRKKRGLAPSESSESAREEEDNGAKSFVPFPGARPDDGDDSENSSLDSPDPPEDDSFIVDDDGGAVAQLPMQFSMNTHQDLAHHFKIICQLFVHLAVRPVRKRRSYMEHVMKNDEYFSVPLQIARRKLSGLRDSLVTSSVWRSDFKNKLEKYPIFELSSLDFAIPSCDACHLGGRMSTLVGRVSGLPYEKMGFEPLDEAKGYSSDESDNEERFETTKEFNLGRFCAKRTQVFHKFTHWEYALYSALLLEVEELRAKDGTSGFVRVAFAKGIQPPEDLTDADGIMEWLDQRGIIDMEWRNIRNLMESARNLEMAAKRGEDDIDVS